MSDSIRHVNIVVVGPTGCGKSRFCNFLLEDDNAFKVSSSLQSVTKGVQVKYKTINVEKEIVTFQILDTQGLANPTTKDEEIIKVLKEAVSNKITFVTFFIILFSPVRITDEIRNALEFIIDGFGLDQQDRKENVLLLLSHCEYFSENLRNQYYDECKADRTIRRILKLETLDSARPSNAYCIGLPQIGEVDELEYKGCMDRMEIEKKWLITYLLKPIPPVTPLSSSCIIL